MDSFHGIRCADVGHRVEDQVDIQFTIGTAQHAADERAGVTNDSDRDTSVKGHLRQQGDRVAVGLTVVKKEVRIARQTVTQMHARQRCASGQMKWRARVADLQEPQRRGQDYAAVEGGHA